MKILFIAGHEFLYNPQNGGQQCSLRNYNLLKNIFGEKNVYLCMFSNYKYDTLSSNIRIFPTQKNKIELLWNTLTGRNVCSRKIKKEAVNYINRLRADIIFCDSSTIGGILKDIKGKALRLVFFHNIERNYAKNKLLHDGIAYTIPLFSYWYNEKQAVKVADYCIFLNERDQKEAEQIYGYTKNYILPITFEDKYEEKLAVENRYKPALLFVGSLFAPNLFGIKWFSNEVMPLLPDYILYIAGKNMESKKKELERENVKVIGTVENLSNYYNQANAVIIPIFFGNGMKVKTAEAMMYGKNIFATKEALEGYDIETVRNRGIFECNTKDDFVKHIKANVNTCSGINQKVRHLFLSKYETKAIENDFRNFLNRCIEGNKTDAEIME